MVRTATAYKAAWFSVFFGLSVLSFFWSASEAQAVRGNRRGGCVGDACSVNPTCSGGTCTSNPTCSGGNCASNSTCSGGSCALNSTCSGTGCSTGGHTADSALFAGLGGTTHGIAPVSDARIYPGNCHNRLPNGTYEYGACVIENGVYHMIRVLSDGSLFIDRRWAGLGTQWLPEHLRKDLKWRYDKKYFTDAQNRVWAKGIDPVVHGRLKSIYGNYWPKPPSETLLGVAPSLNNTPAEQKVAAVEPAPTQKSTTSHGESPAAPKRDFTPGPPTAPKRAPAGESVAEKSRPKLEEDQVDCDALANIATVNEENKIEPAVQICTTPNSCALFDDKKRDLPKLTFQVRTVGNAMHFEFTNGKKIYLFVVPVGAAAAKYRACFDNKEVVASLRLASAMGDAEDSHMFKANIVSIALKPGANGATPSFGIKRFKEDYL